MRRPTSRDESNSRQGLHNLPIAGDTYDGWTVIDANVVFDGEEGWNKLAADNANLRHLVEQLESQLSELRGSKLLPPPQGSAENST